MRTRPFWWLFLAYVTGLYSWYGVQVHQIKFLVDGGFTSEQAAFALGLVGLSGIAGQISIGHLSDRIGRELAWTISAMGFVICYLLLLLLDHYPSTALMYLMAASQGLLGYGMASVYGAMPAELFQSRRYGPSSPWVQPWRTCSSTASLQGPWRRPLSRRIGPLSSGSR